MSEVNFVQNYSGKAPYAFISYCHDELSKIVPILRLLTQANCRIWRDKEIQAGDEWSDVIAQHIEDCEVVLFFASKASCDSEYCRDELSLAKDLRKPVVMIFIEENVKLPKGMNMHTMRYQRIELASPKKMVQKLLQSDALTECIASTNESDEIDDDNMQVEDIDTEEIEQEIKAKQRVLIVVAMTWVLLGLVISVVLIKFIIPMVSSRAAARPYSVEMSDELTDMTFMLDGEVYQLPCKFSVFLDRGWKFDYLSGIPMDGLYNDDVSSKSASSKNQNVDIDGNPFNEKSIITGHSEEKNIVLMKGEIKINLTVYNNGGNSVYLKDCNVWSFGINNLQNKPEIFSLPKSINLGSTIDDIINAYGVPVYRDASEDSETIMYISEDSTRERAVMFRVYTKKADKKYNAIVLSNGDYEHISNTTSTDPNIPVFFGDYNCIEDEGDITTPVVTIDGVKYMLPAPVGEFIDNGWNIYTAPSALPSTKGDTITLAQKEKQMKCGIFNFSTRQHYVKDTAVDSIEYNADSKFTLTLPGGITLGSTKQELDRLITEDFKVTEKDGKLTYKYEDSAVFGYHLQIVVDKATQKVESIKVASFRWHYPQK